MSRKDNFHQAVRRGKGWPDNYPGSFAIENQYAAIGS